MGGEHTTRSPAHHPKHTVRMMPHRPGRCHPRLPRGEEQTDTLVAFGHIEAALGRALMPFLGGL